MKKVITLFILIILFNNTLFSQNLFINNVPKNELSTDEAKFQSLIDSLYNHKIKITLIYTDRAKRFYRKNAGFKKNKNNPVNHTVVKIWYIDPIKNNYGYYEHEFIYDSINVKTRSGFYYGFGIGMRPRVSWIMENKYKSELDMVDDAAREKARNNNGSVANKWCCGRDDFKWYKLDGSDIPSNYLESTFVSPYKLDGSDIPFRKKIYKALPFDKPSH